MFLLFFQKWNNEFMDVQWENNEFGLSQNPFAQNPVGSISRVSKSLLGTKAAGKVALGKVAPGRLTPVLFVLRKSDPLERLPQGMLAPPEY